MTTLEIVLASLLIFMILLYGLSKYSKEKDLNEIIKEVKRDFNLTANTIGNIANKATDILFDDAVQKAIKEFIMIVEEMNVIAKAKGQTYLSSEQKKLNVISRLGEWLSNVTGSVDKAVDFVETHQSRIEATIEDYVSFSNKMVGKDTLSEAEKIIQEQLNHN